MKSRKSSHEFSRFAALALAVMLVAACSPNITILTPTAPAGSTTNATAGATTATGATGSAGTSAAVASNASGQASCVGGKDPTENPPAGGSTKQLPAPRNGIDP